MTLFRSLVQYAETRRDLPPPCYRLRRIDWTLDITVATDGPMAATVNPFGEVLPVPKMRRSGPKPAPLLAVDDAVFVLGQVGDGVTQKQADSRTAAFWTQMAAWVQGPHTHPAVTSALYVLQQTTAVCAEPVPARDSVGIRVNGLWLHLLDEAVACWLDIVDEQKGGSVGLCVACGRTMRLATSLPNSIPAHLVPGADREVQLTVLTKFERIHDGELPICLRCGDTAALVMETLLSDRSRSPRFNGQDSVTTVFGLGSTAADAAAVQLFAAVRVGLT